VVSANATCIINPLVISLTMHSSKGTGKITPERIGRLEGMGFEWDPQKAQWNMLFDKLVKFKEEIGHCKVPKVRDDVWNGNSLTFHMSIRTI
jgi:hypothetical protein